MFKKGQVSTEYLVILAVVLVVALIVVYLVGGFSGLGAGALETASKNYWGSTSPFAITTFKVSGTTMELELTNNDLETLGVTDVSVGGLTIYSTAKNFTSGQKAVITGTLGTTCGAAGTPFSYDNVVITYNKGAVSAIKQTGTKPLVGKCS